MTSLAWLSGGWIGLDMTIACFRYGMPYRKQAICGWAVMVRNG
jgi:hypothetical protein